MLGTVKNGKYPVKYLNLPMEDLKTLTIKQLKDGKAVWFGSDVGQFSNREEGLLTLDAYNVSNLFDTDFPMTKEQRLDYCESLMTHAMVITGVDLDENDRPIRWKVENSWGKDRGKDGFYVMSDEWFEEYAYQILLDRKYFTDEQAKQFDLVHELSIVAQAIEATLSEKDSIDDKVRALLATTRNAFYIGRGQDYYVAMEASLKLKEISYIQCEGFAAGELKHGTISLIEDGTPVLALISSDEQLARHTRGNVSEVGARGANVLTIVEENVAKEGDDIILMSVHPYLSPISMVVPTQLIAYFATLQRGLDVDKPRNLAKSVTVE